jgi:hypothetical protein
MKAPLRTRTEEVAGGRLATSAQPPRATPIPASSASSQCTRPPIGSFVLPYTRDALEEGLRCLTAYPPLPEMVLANQSPQRKTP